MICKTYLRRTQAGPSRKVKEQQKQASPTHVRAIFSAYVHSLKWPTKIPHDSKLRASWELVCESF